MIKDDSVPGEDGRQGQADEEQRFRRLVQSVADYAIYMIDLQGVVQTWNTGAERFKGYTEAEIIGHHFSRFYTEEDRRSGLPGRALETAAQDGRFEQEGWHVRKDGTRIWAHVVIEAIRDGDGLLIEVANRVYSGPRGLQRRRLSCQRAHAPPSQRF